jgi:hypothetical protein
MCVALFVLLFPLAASATEPWEPGQALDICIEAALKQRPGILVGWRQAGGGDMPLYAVAVLNEEGRTGEATCDPANPDNTLEFKNRGGLVRYDMVKRASFPEAQARANAPQVFVGPVRIITMDLKVNFAGKPLYIYKMILPSGHKATVNVEGTVGRVMKAELE